MTLSQNLYVDKSFLLGLMDDLVETYDRYVLQNIINLRTEKSMLSIDDIFVKNGMLYLHQWHNVVNQRGVLHKDHSNDFLKGVEIYYNYFSSLLTFTQKLTNIKCSFPYQSFHDGKVDGSIGKYIDLCNENRDIWCMMYRIIGCDNAPLGMDTTIPLGVDIDGNVLYCFLHSRGHCCIDINPYLDCIDCPVVLPL